MTKHLYEEALADVKKVKELAEANAQKAIIETVTPRIRDFIEQVLFKEASLDDEEEFATSAPGSVPLPDVELMTDSSEEEKDLSAVSLPDEEGKVTMDLDNLSVDEDDSYELSAESVKALSPVLTATGSARNLELEELRLGETLSRFSSAGAFVKRSNGYKKQIVEMISRVEDMYDYVQASMSDPAERSSHEARLEGYFKELVGLQEQTMSNRKNRMMNEEDVTLKLTGLPDDIDLDSVGVDLITGDEEGGEEVDLDLDAGDEGGEDMGGDDMGDLDLGGEEELPVDESLDLSDDTIVEIDENMLRREIARMRRLREQGEKVPSTCGYGVDKAQLEDFGGGDDMGDGLDQDLPHKSAAKAALPLGENDDLMPEDEEEVKKESLKRRLAFETRLQERSKRRAALLRTQIAEAKSSGNGRLVASLRNAYATVARRFNESVSRQGKISNMLSESVKPVSSRHTQNGASQVRADAAVKQLRNKLAETNLINVKLTYTNKLLQNESLTSRQKANIIEQLDAAATVREAKLVYESLSKALVTTPKSSLKEGTNRQVLGSSSSPTRSSSVSSNLNEGYEADRWARLAGIK